MRLTTCLLAIFVLLTTLGCQPQSEEPLPTRIPPPPVKAPPASPSPDVSASPDVSGTPVASASPAVSATPDDTATPEVSSTPGVPIAVDLKPLPGKDAPGITRKTTVKFQTTAGDVVMEIYPEAAPNAAKRFIELVESGFYNDTPVSRVVPNFVAQFGINWRSPHRSYEKKEFDDDPTLFSLDRGTLAFAKSGLNHNSTQVFINYKNNDHLTTPEYNFTVFGKVVKGMEIVDSFAVVGDPEKGLNQDRLWEDGADYIEELDKKPTMIEKATVVK